MRRAVRSSRRSVSPRLLRCPCSDGRPRGADPCRTPLRRDGTRPCRRRVFRNGGALFTLAGRLVERIGPARDYGSSGTLVCLIDLHCRRGTLPSWPSRMRRRWWTRQFHCSSLVQSAAISSVTEESAGLRPRSQTSVNSDRHVAWWARGARRSTDGWLALGVRRGIRRRRSVRLSGSRPRAAPSLGHLRRLLEEAHLMLRFDHVSCRWWRPCIGRGRHARFVPHLRPRRTGHGSGLRGNLGRGVWSDMRRHANRRRCRRGSLDVTAPSDSRRHGSARSAWLRIDRVGATPTLIIGAILAYGLGWGWPGLFNLAIVRNNTVAPAAATGITQSGVYLGAVSGPLIFGSVVDDIGYPAAWLGAGAAGSSVRPRSLSAATCSWPIANGARSDRSNHQRADRLESVGPQYESWIRPRVSRLPGAGSSDRAALRC